jgi:two-component system phosphate regulon sensor histidine kinase PhoR
VIPKLRSRFFWRILFALGSVLLVAGFTIIVVFMIKMPQGQHVDSPAIIQALAGASAIGIAVALVMGLWLVHNIQSALDEITSVARSMASGDFEARVRNIKNLRNDEFGILGLTLNLLGNEISDRMATLSQERAQLQAMLSGMIEGIVAIDEEDRILFSNRAADRLLKTDLGGARGQKIGETSGVGVLLPALLAARQPEGFFKGEINLSDGGSFSSVEINATRFTGDQEDGVVIVLHDVTDLRRLETVRRDFVANVSHELKTPLTSVKGYLETLLSGAKDEPEMLTRFLKKMETNVERLISLVQDILSLGSIEAQSDNFPKEKLEFKQTILQILSQHEHEASRKKITLDSSGLQALRVFGDGEALSQIADNLVSNAIKYTSEGGKVEISLKSHPEGVQFQVKDTGFGIPKDQIPRIFERFYRVDKARSRELGGTGLGLSIVKHLVSAMGGRITVESEVGRGSVFTVYLAEAR